MRHVTVLVTLALVTAYAAAAVETEDYPDGCEGYPVVAIGEAIEGELAPPDDEQDHVGLSVEERHVGSTVHVEYAADTFHTNIQVFTPECGHDVVPVPHKACEKAHCPKGHDNANGKGHEMCMGNGHLSECTGSEGGTSDADSVDFTPTRAGIYVILISVDTKSFHGENGGGGCDDFDKGCGGGPCRDCSCIDCTELSSSSDGSSTSGGDGPTVQDCHVACGGRSFQYAITTVSDGDDTVPS